MAHSSHCSGYHARHYEIVDINNILTDPWDVDEILIDLGHQPYTRVSAHYLQSPPLCRPCSLGRAYSRGGDTVPSRGCSAVDANCRRMTLRSRSPSPSAPTVYASAHISRGSTTAIKEPKAKRPKMAKPLDVRGIAVKMDSPVVKAVLDMGIPEAEIKKTILARLAEKGEDFASSEALVDAIFNSEVRGNGRQSDTDENFTTQDAPMETVLSSEVKTKARKTKQGSVKPVDDDSLKLKEEIRVLKEQKQCKICMDNDLCVVFVPCGHLVCCDSCAPSVKTCPICRAKIKKTVRAYLS